LQWGTIVVRSLGKVQLEAGYTRSPPTLPGQI
jgi:hypothetical protein